MNRRLIYAAMAIVLAFGGCTSRPSVGSDAPAFTAKDAEGNTIQAGAFEGEVRILDFWAVW